MYVIITPFNLGIAMVEKAGTSSLYDVILNAKKNNARFGKLVVKKKDFSAAYSFAIVRDPIDRALSGYADRVAPGHLLKGKSWDQFVDYLCVTPDDELNPHFVSQTSKLYCDGKLLVDRIGQLEKIANEWPTIQQEVSARTGFELPELPRLNRSNNKPVVTLEQQARLSERFAVDFVNLGY